MITDQTSQRQISARWQSGMVQSNGIAIHYLRTGLGKKPVVCAHGITDNGACWSGVAKALESRYECIMYDTRGHGLSDKPDWGYDIDTLADDLYGVIQAFGLHKPLLMGHSLGGATIARFLSRYPDSAYGAILEDPVRFEMGNEQRQELLDVRNWVIDNIGKWGSLDREELLHFSIYKGRPGWSRLAEHEQWTDAKKQVSPKVTTLLDKIINVPDDLAGTTVPVLICKADATPAKRVIHRELIAKMPNVSMVHIDGAGHNVRRDKPEQFLHEITRFLDSIGY
jgi:pimeloyl-ACP methyl ester carboxylesterase